MKPIVAGSHVVAFPGPVARWWRRLLRGMRYGARGRPAQTRVAHGEVVHRLALG